MKTTSNNGAQYIFELFVQNIILNPIQIKYLGETEEIKYRPFNKTEIEIIDMMISQNLSLSNEKYSMSPTFIVSLIVRRRPPIKLIEKILLYFDNNVKIKTIFQYYYLYGSSNKSEYNTKIIDYLKKLNNENNNQ